MSSHPGTTMNDAVDMAIWLKRWGYSPEQVQDFYPTPGTISTVMYYTGIHPMTGKSVYVTTDYREKQLQRALLQYSRPENANLVREALKKAGREDLIGHGTECLVRPAFAQDARTRQVLTQKGNKGSHSGGFGSKKSKSLSSRQKQLNRPEKGLNQMKNEQVKQKKSKLDRIFGDDAARIRMESAKMGDKFTEKRSSRNRTSTSAKNKKISNKKVR